jgi:hypothetical protein
MVSGGMDSAGVVQRPVLAVHTNCSFSVNTMDSVFSSALRKPLLYLETFKGTRSCTNGVMQVE